MVGEVVREPSHAVRFLESFEQERQVRVEAVGVEFGQDLCGGGRVEEAEDGRDVLRVPLARAVEFHAEDVVEWWHEDCQVGVSEDDFADFARRRSVEVRDGVVEPELVRLVRVEPVADVSDDGLDFFGLMEEGVHVLRRPDVMELQDEAAHADDFEGDAFLLEFVVQFSEQSLLVHNGLP